jgi:hypothetical protein
MFLNAVYVKGAGDLSLARQATWNHVVHTDHRVPKEESR